MLELNDIKDVFILSGGIAIIVYASMNIIDFLLERFFGITK